MIVLVMRASTKVKVEVSRVKAVLAIFSEMFLETFSAALDQAVRVQPEVQICGMN